MKILLTGGGSGGHFYPIIAVVEQIEKISEEQKLLPPQFYYMAPEPTDEQMLFAHGIEFVEIPAGKLRIYPSFQNFTDIFKTLGGMVKAVFKMFSIFPDIVFGKGGYASFPALFAAWLLRIPIIIHESDSVPGRANNLVGKIADKIAVSYEEAAKYFPKNKVAWTGQPIRKTIARRSREEAEKFLQLESGVPVMLILGGSLGAKKINELILQSLPILLPNWQIIHQTGRSNLENVTDMVDVIEKDEALRKRYHAFDYLPDSVLSMASSVADIVVSRAGSTIFEIASWGLPSIIIPISESNGDHQRQNALFYARTGAAIIIEEANLTAHIFAYELNKLRSNPELMKKMSDSASNFIKGDAAFTIAKAIIDISLGHEK